MIKDETYFETIKCKDFEIFNLEYHKKRISNTIGLNISLDEYIYPTSAELLKCKVIYTKNEIIDISYTPYKPRGIKSFKIIEDNNIDYKYKSTNRTNIDKLYEKKKNSDEIVIIKNDLLTDTSIANIAIQLDNIWYTPKTPLLNGTTRQRLIDEGKLKEKDIDLEMVFKAQKLALMNAMIDFKVIDGFSLTHL